MPPPSSNTPETHPAPDQGHHAVTVDGVLRQITELNQRLTAQTKTALPRSAENRAPKSAASHPAPQPAPVSSCAPARNRALDLDALLALGFHPHMARELIRQHAPGHAFAERKALEDYLAAQWRQAPPPDDARHENRPHVFLGPSGSGKTTALGKWLAQTVLQQKRPAVVWRLNGQGPNTAEQLTVLCEALGVPLERTWNADPCQSRQSVRSFMDLPGTDWRSPAALHHLEAQVRSFPNPVIHLVLNLAYETDCLLDQVRAFAKIPVSDLILAHGDEERRPGKVWSLVLGTKHAIGYFSAGQNMPGEFKPASAKDVLPLDFP